MHDRPFHWGIASSAPQSEGAAFEDGKGASIWDEFSRKRGRIAGKHTPAVSASFYHRYHEDLDLLQALGIPNFRTSIAWPRIFPTGNGHAHPKGIDFYDRLTDACLARNITPWYTLFHWDLPQALENKGGWTHRDTVEHYADYATYVLRKLGDRVQHWMALNEPLAFTGAGYFFGIHAPGRKGMDSFLPAMHHAALAQAEGIRRIQNEGKIAGTTFSCSWKTPASNDEKDQLAARRTDALLNRLFPEVLLGYGYPASDLPFLRKAEKWFKPNDDQFVKAVPDFIGLQNYTREVVQHSWWTPYIRASILPAHKRKVPATLLNWEIYPEGIGLLLQKFDAYPEVKSIIVTENGAAFDDKISAGEIHDSRRVQYLQQYIDEVMHQRAQGIKIDGYFAWSLTDNFEWAEGYYPRFGLIHVDYTNQQRIIKASGKYYGKRVREHISGTHEPESIKPESMSMH